MLMMAKMSGMLSGGQAAGLSVSDVFATTLASGIFSDTKITTGIDMLTHGGLVWAKERNNNTRGHFLVDTLRGGTKRLDTSSASAEASSSPGYINSFEADGFWAESDSSIISGGTNHVVWSFRRAPKFFDVQAVAHVTGTPTVVDFSALGTIGMAALKQTDGTGNWTVKHIYDLTRGLALNTTDVAFSEGNYTMDATTFTIRSGIASGNYSIMAWAHDPNPSGVVQCGSFTTNGSGLASVNLGWQPQFALHKRSDAVDDWIIADSARGTNTSTTNALFPNLSAAENTSEPIRLGFTSSGFDVNGSNSATSIYLAIRAP